jgi:hypothetical protein
MTREESIELKQQLKQKYKDTLKIKCIADEIWLYCIYLFDNLDQLRYDSYYCKEDPKIPLPEEERNKFYETLEKLYQRIRGETFYMGKKPSAIGAGLFYIVCVMRGLYINQKPITDAAAIATLSLSKSYKLLKKHLDL